jgi:threonine 3-dehydrogenase
MLTIKGIYGREMFETWYAMSVLLEGGLDLAPVITGRYGYRDFEAAFADAASGKAARSSSTGPTEEHPGTAD